MRRPPTWFILVCLLGAAGAIFALSAFPSAFPLVGVDLRMDRPGARQAAAEVAQRAGWGTETFRTAVSFGDAAPGVRIFLELEGDVEGPDTPSVLAERGLSAYLWRVRHVREGEATEAEVHFTPAGDPYGFRLTLPEDAAGADLPAAEARALAEAEAADWGFDPVLHTPVETSRTVQPGGRADHTFVYLRQGSAVGDADARLRLEVAGDQLSAVEPFLRVPEAFERRFEAMRAVNQRIAFAASAFFMVVLLLGGCGAGIVYLIRRDAVAWRPSLALGGTIALLLALSTVNGLPLAWMGYDSAIPEGVFLFMSAALLPVGILAAGTLFFAWIIASAEGLGRLAFPRHPAFWRVWSRDSAASPEIMGRTIGGYAVAGIELGLVVAFYALTARLDGWWTPADALVSPDLLATYQPWLGAVAMSLTAGVWEECVFRAVPLAGAALLGRRFGRPGLWIAAALVIQALAFAAAHADYPQQPAYARVLELSPAAFLWGLIYLRFGLFPVILTHAAYNLTLFSIPLFAAGAPGIAVHRGMVMAVGLLPLGIVLWRRAQHGRVANLPATALNGGWTPARGQASGPRGDLPAAFSGPHGPGGGQPRAGEVGVLPADSGGREPGGRRSHVPPGKGLRVPGWLAAGALVGGVVLWILARPTLPPDLRLQGNRGAAVQVALDSLSARGVDPGDWTLSARPVSGWGNAGRFLAREGGAAAQRTALEAGYLARPAWQVRLARFTGPVEERAEEWLVAVEDGGVRGVVHRLPEARPGARLDESAARRMVQAALVTRGVDPDSLRELSARANDRPRRLDWTLVHEDSSVPVPAAGEARITVQLAGDEVTGVSRSIHVPEEWERADRDRNTRWALTLIPAGMVLGGALLLAVGLGVVGLARSHIPPRPVAAVAALLLGTGGLAILNGLPGVDAAANTTSSLVDQRVQALVGALLGILVVSAVLALALGAAARLAHIHRPEDRTSRNLGAALGALLAGLVSVGGAIAAPDRLPPPTLTGAGGVVPWLSGLQSIPQAFVALLVLLLLAVALMRNLDRRFAPGQVAGVFVAAGALLLPGGVDASLWARALLGAAVGALLFGTARLAMRASSAFLPALVTVFLALGALGDLLDRPFPGAAAGALVSAALLLVVGRGAVVFLERSGPAQDPVSVGGEPPAPGTPGGDPQATHVSDNGP